MHSKPLTTIIGAEPKLGNPLNYLDKAVLKYGEIPTFFSKYKNPVGVELEIENVPVSFRRLVNDTSIYWKHVEDNSLKHAGAEFISCPINGQNIDYAIHEFANLSNTQAFQYSVRTSTHVHVNVSFMNWDEFVCLILLSAYLEPLLYSLCKEERKGNPYCYPISSLPPLDVFAMGEDLKYCGINTAPVRRLLTVEYRQLHGTNDWRLIRRWIQVLCKIYYFAKYTPSKEIIAQMRDVIRTKNHDILLKKILGATCVLFPNPTLCDQNLLWVLAALDFAENM